MMLPERPEAPIHDNPIHENPPASGRTGGNSHYGVPKMKRRQLITATVTAFVVGALLQAANAQTAKRRIERDTPPKAESDRKVIRVDPVDGRNSPRNTSRVRYIRTAPSYRHVRVTERALRDNRLADTRSVIVRSTGVRPRTIVRFEDRRQNEIKSVIRLYRDGNRDQAISIWGGFVASLSDYDDPVDLDDVMLYVARESCFRENDAMLFRAQKLEYLRNSADLLDDYIDDLVERRSGMINAGGRISGETLGDVESELVRVQAERDIVAIRLRMAEEAYDRDILVSRDYEDRFGGVMTDLYREASIRISVSSGPQRKYLRP